MNFVKIDYDSSLIVLAEVGEKICENVPEKPSTKSASHSLFLHMVISQRGARDPSRDVFAMASLCAPGEAGSRARRSQHGTPAAEPGRARAL